MNKEIRQKNHRSHTSLVIGKPFLVTTSQNMSQQEISNYDTNYFVDPPKQPGSHTKCTILIRHLEETIKEKSQKCQILEKENQKLIFKLDQSTKVLTKEREDFKILVKLTQREDTQPSLSWKAKFSDLKSKHSQQLSILQSQITLLEKRLKDSEQFNKNSHKKIESLQKEIDSKSKHLCSLSESKSDLSEKLELCTILACRLLDLFKQVLNKTSQSLNIQYMNLENSFMPILSKILEFNPNIESVNLEGNLISDEGLKDFCNSFINCTSNLHTINLACNKISTEGAWKLVNSSIERENSTNKLMKKIVLSYNIFEESELFVRAFEEIQPIRVGYPFIKIKKEDLERTRGVQLRKVFHSLSDKMFESKTVKLIAAMLDRVEVLQTGERELEMIMIKNKKETFEGFRAEKVGVVAQQALKAGLQKLSMKTQKIQQLHAENDLDITLIMAQRHSFALSYVKKLIKSGLNLNTLDKKLDETFLMYAARTNNMSLCKLLVSKVQNIDTRNTKGMNAFLVACYYNNFEIADYLILSGGRLDSSDSRGSNAIHHAIKEGKARKIERLIDMGISVNWTDNKHKSPLHYAAKSGDTLMGELLIRLGADPNMTDYKGRSPVTLAQDRGKAFFAKSLMEFGAKSIRMVIGKEEIKKQVESCHHKSLSGLMSYLENTVDSTKKMHRDLEKTHKMLDSGLRILNKSIT